MVPNDECNAEAVRNGPKRSFMIYCEQALTSTDPLTRPAKSSPHTIKLQQGSGQRVTAT